MDGFPLSLSCTHHARSVSHHPLTLISISFTLCIVALLVLVSLSDLAVPRHNTCPSVYPLSVLPAYPAFIFALLPVYQKNAPVVFTFYPISLVTFELSFEYALTLLSFLHSIHLGHTLHLG
ncbi:hypothetical protein F5050DRAFT_777372 [Lentinula boryana]|uniref:Uncharacterized protein n=1 Tax=Lentinula boryana TaxID=40481 RepID=A0ABQ8QN51_9AGAR|nr:hypothetical protein F5050DRAFT_777372 [Lentinula boryana]